jgi:hypothetical protein
MPSESPTTNAAVDTAHPSKRIGNPWWWPVLMSKVGDARRDHAITDLDEHRQDMPVATSRRAMPNRAPGLTGILGVSSRRSRGGC